MTSDTRPDNLQEHTTQLQEVAQAAPSGRSAHLLYGGPGTTLSQTVIALRSGASLAEHQNPGEATLLVLHGNVRLHAGDQSWEGSQGDLLVVPEQRHGLDALTDATVLLTAAKLSRST
ncbi:MAG: cupin domain-containing protein [Nocardioidaceae bacterium]